MSLQKKTHSLRVSHGRVEVDDLKESQGIGVPLVRSLSSRNMTGNDTRKHIKNVDTYFDAIFAAPSTSSKKTFSTITRHVTTVKLVREKDILEQLNRPVKLVRAGEWLQSNVIYSLLQRPAIYKEWLKVLHSQPQLKGGFGWNQHDTGRVEGYPENNAKPRLQDLLEYYKSSDNAAALAQFAFEKIAFPSHPPQAPPKDYKDHHTATLQGLMDDTESWDNFMSAIPEDELCPTDTRDFDFSMMNDGFSREMKVFY
ncbi:hypothetical protein EKO04_008441 [Ascochyta lentis]|uniref:Uncharacterized protein n=1 Tax=Ascochyta lentis TaxID=205686 RepID=A0A8H7IZU5_9PLEO|nr:hypothetical protein EKO04_008441 [Ascochyta lentis]